MNRLIPAAALAALPGLAAAVPQKAPDARPNFAVILLDDVGFADFSCYGGPIPTPHIDALASKGVRMSQMYNCARSCPTRASLLTGLYPQQAGVGFMMDNWAEKISPAYQGYLNSNCVTIAEVMDRAGYLTAIAGKWHVGEQAGVTPLTRGFRESIHQAGGVTFFPNPKANIHVNGVRIPMDDERLPKHWYSTDLWTDWSMKYVEQAKDEGVPFMLYLPYTAAHFPLQAPAKEIAAFKGKFSQGWDRLRQQVYERQVAMGLLGKTYPLTPDCRLVPRWEDVDEAQKVQSEHIMEIYAAMIRKVDDNIGRFVARLTQLGMMDNTVIILLCDNGGNAEGKTVYGTYEGANPGSVASTVFLGQAWAGVSNTPFFFYKHHTHEGGIATGCVVSWPAGIPAGQNGKVVHQPGHVIDIMATLVGISGAEYPAQFKGNRITPMQGINLLPVWLGQQAERREPIFWEHEENLALRDGKWKLVKEIRDQHWQLFDMEADRTEMNDLSATQPKVAAEMRRKLDAMYKKVGAAPLHLNRNFRWVVPYEDYER